MQDHKDPRAWSIVERYEQESDLATHRANPFYAVFAGYASEFLDKPPEIRFFNELDTSKPAKTE
ncbi:hypothetical protein B0H11DRAFT_1979154 [Mycena galericulata]|nr:hypothetical protein B0H11DRAFT_1979154 [Mycena galericulata]